MSTQTILPDLRGLAADPFTAAQQATLDTIKTGASSSWILASSALIFFMQLGFIMIEASVSRKQHWSGIVLKKMMDTVAAAIAWWVVGFGIAFGVTDSRGFIGMSDNTFSFGSFYDYTAEDLYLKWIFQFAFANCASAIVGGLLMERVRIETFGIFSFFMILFIYPVIACWTWNSTGWLFIKGIHDFAGCGPIHLLGSIVGLTGSIIAGARYNRFQGVAFPFIFGKSRQAKQEKYNQQQLDKIKNIDQLDEIKELVEEGRISKDDVECIKNYTIREFFKPNLDLEDESSLWGSIGTFVLWLGWFFFNGGSSYSLYNSVSLPSKIITNTILASTASGGTVYFVKKPISLWVTKSFQKKGEYYKTFRSSQRFDSGSVCNGILAGLVAITAPCDTVEPWAAICTGVIGGILYCFFAKLIVALNIDDPLESGAVHYANAIWGHLACIIFDYNRGFVSGHPGMGAYLAVQVYGPICISLWGISLSALYFGICNYFDVLRYHPVIEIVGVSRLKMGEISEKWLAEIRSIKEIKIEDYESQILEKVVDHDAQVEEFRNGPSGDGKVQNVPLAKRTAKVSNDNELTI